MVPLMVRNYCHYMMSLILTGMTIYGFSSSHASAKTDLASQPAESPSAVRPSPLLPSFWNMAYGPSPSKKVHLYKNDDNPYIQEVNFSFRAQYQAAAIHSNQGNYPGSHNWTSEWRRFRLGWNAKVLNDFKLTNIWNIGGLDSAGSYNNGVWDDHGSTKGSLYEGTVQYNYKSHTFGFGKILPVVLAENRVSSSSFKLPEYAVAENTLVCDSAWSVFASNDTSKDRFGYYAAVWSSTNDSNKAVWGTWESAFTTLGLSYGLDKILLEKGRFHIDWIHSFDNGDIRTWKEDFVGPLARDVLAAYYIGRQGRFELTAQALWGFDPVQHKDSSKNVVDPGNIFAITIMPSYDITGHVQFATRFQYAHGNNAVSLNKRYNTTLSQTKGEDGNFVDSYYAIACGFNFFLYENDPPRLKIMTMLEYGNSTRESSATKGGFTGWQFICGLYTNF